MRSSYYKLAMLVQTNCTHFDDAVVRWSVNLPIFNPG
jgi:hypothetical protein